MTVIVTCNLPDGVVIGSDSLISFTDNTSGKVVLTYPENEKVFDISSEIPIAIACYDAASLKDRTIKSYIEEFSATAKKPATVEEFCDALITFFQPYFSGVKDRNLGLVVAGYSDGLFLPEVWNVSLPAGDKACKIPSGTFSSAWFAEYTQIARLIKGFDPRVIDETIQFFIKEKKVTFDPAVDGPKLGNLLGKYETAFIFNGMPLQSGVDYVKYLLGMTIGIHELRLENGVCGGNIRMAVVSRKGVSWITRSSLT